MIWYEQVEMRIGFCYFLFDDLLDFDIKLCDEIDRVLPHHDE
jgi:hypothetical protein